PARRRARPRLGWRAASSPNSPRGSTVMLWILLTAAAAPLQVARNALQRGLVGEAGPWGATLVRFLFGLPFSLTIFLVVRAWTPDAAPHLSGRFMLTISAGALTQIAATASLLLAM